MLFFHPITIIVYVGSLIWISPTLTLVVFIIIPFIVVILGNISKVLRKRARQGQRRLSTVITVMDETLYGLKIIKAFNAENMLFVRFKNLYRKVTKLMVNLFRRRNLASPLTEFLASIIIVAIMWYGSSMVLSHDGSLSAEAFIGYMIIFSQVISPAKGLSAAHYNVQKGMASLDRIEEILNLDIKIHEKENAIIKDKFEEKIEYKNVSFRYRKDIPVLKSIDLEIKKGEIVAIVGQSGSGKSTLVDLLPRFFDVTDGAIFIDGIDIRDLKLREYRSLFGIVSQEPILFNDTFFNNIAFGKPNASMEEVVRAAKIANAYDFIMQTPLGFYTNIGERGNKLSGGQRQRISIARAVFKNPPILILDEATSSLDSESEKLVQKALDNLMKDRTTLVIAHRLSTIVNADKIIVLSEGEIVEQGKHDELLALNGYYKKLYDLQMFG
jgi:subfamily B ATP-binding cassette protein MsbA